MLGPWFLSDFRYLVHTRRPCGERIVIALSDDAGSTAALLERRRLDPVANGPVDVAPVLEGPLEDLLAP